MSVPNEQIVKALAALKQYFAAANSSKKAVRQLLQNRVPILVRFQLKRLQKRSGLFAKALATPHPVYHDGVEACLFVSDKQRAEKEAILSVHPFVKKLIPLTNLKLHYHEYEKLRRLYHSYDVFYADRSVVGMMPQFLGKKFISSKKSPLPVSLKQLDNAHRGTTLVCSASNIWDVRIGDIQMTPEELSANAAAVISTVVELLERKSADVQSIAVKLDQDGVPPLPVYNSVPLIAEMDDPETFDEEAKQAESALHNEKANEMEVERELNVDASAETKAEEAAPVAEAKPAEAQVEAQAEPKSVAPASEPLPTDEAKTADAEEKTEEAKVEEVKTEETKTEEKAATPKKATPKKTTPKKGTPKKATPKKATPKKTTPKKGTPKKATPKKEEAKVAEAEEKPEEAKVEEKATTPKKGTPKKETPKKETPKKPAPASASKRPRSDAPQQGSAKKAKTPSKAAQ